MSSPSPLREPAAIFAALDLKLPAVSSGATLETTNPSTGTVLAVVPAASSADYDAIVHNADRGFKKWRNLPAPRRGEIVRQIGEEFRRQKDALGALIALETGKVRSEGLGEVQEVIDICDFAVGLSRQLYGLSMHSERPAHRMFEQWHPLGPIGVITAFNFPMAVWAWNAMIAMVCGNSVVWKPSPKTPLSALAAQRLADGVLRRHDFAGVSMLVLGDHQIGERMAQDKRLPLISFTGSVAAGREVAETVASRLGRSLLELGGNNGVIVMDDADLKLALRAILFGAAGTAGQRCTSTRRLFLQHGIAPEFTEKLVAAFRTIRIGNPLQDGILMGPLIDEEAIAAYEHAITSALAARGSSLLCGGWRRPGAGHFVEPAVIRATWPLEVAMQETFAPILYVFEFEILDQALDWHNAVPQGLSSSIFTTSLKSAEKFLSATGSDCGIANVNIGTSGAEIGGAFGGEKETGGGRESGSDAWKAYMRRQTCTVNYGNDMPLAQGVEFNL